MPGYRSPHKLCLRTLQKYSTRGWVYRPGEGWIFAELTPDELAEFRSYSRYPNPDPPIIRVRFPPGQVAPFICEVPSNLGFWFADCTILQVHQGTDDKPKRRTWLWTDEVKIYRELGYEITVYRGWGWFEWGIPVEWGPPQPRPQPRYKEHAYIYFLEDEFSGEIGYVGQSMKPEHRLAEHLKGTENPDKVAWIQSRLARGHAIKLFILEKVPGTKVKEREYYWTEYYWNQGHNLTNRVCRDWNRPHTSYRNKQINL